MKMKKIILVAMFGSMMLLQLDLENVNAQQPANLTKVIEEKFILTTPTISTNTTFYGGGETIPQVDVKYESPTTILITGDLINPLGSLGPGIFNSAIWEAMDLLKNQYGFKLQQL
jgi:hypothetical protein